MQLEKIPPPIYVISLKHSQDRRESMRNQLNALQLDFKFFDAVNGSTIDKSLHKIDFDLAAASGHKLLPGIIGCALSHINLYQKMIDENIEEMVILEDDVAFVPEFSNILTKLLQVKPNRAELIYLHSGKAKQYPIKRGIHSCYKLSRIRTPSKKSKRCIIMTAGYYLNKAAAYKLLANAFPISMPADYLLGLIQNNGLNTYKVIPDCVELMDFDSTIDIRS